MNPLIFCSILSTYTIVGAVEYAPGQIKLDFLTPNQELSVMYIPIDSYKECRPLLNDHSTVSL